MSQITCSNYAMSYFQRRIKEIDEKDCCESDTCIHKGEKREVSLPSNKSNDDASDPYL